VSRSPGKDLLNYVSDFVHMLTVVGQVAQETDSLSVEGSQGSDLSQCLRGMQRKMGTLPLKMLQGPLSSLCRKL
jgi:hypothetical protein